MLYNCIEIPIPTAFINQGLTCTANAKDRRNCDSAASGSSLVHCPLSATVLVRLWMLEPTLSIWSKSNGKWEGEMPNRQELDWEARVVSL